MKTFSVEPSEPILTIHSPKETTSPFNNYKRIKDVVKRLEKEFGEEYAVSNITAGITITASMSPSFAVSVTTTVAKKKP